MTEASWKGIGELKLIWSSTFWQVIFRLLYSKLVAFLGSWTYAEEFPWCTTSCGDRGHGAHASSLTVFYSDQSHLYTSPSTASVENGCFNTFRCDDDHDTWFIWWCIFTYHNSQGQFGTWCPELLHLAIKSWCIIQAGFAESYAASMHWTLTQRLNSLVCSWKWREKSARNAHSQPHLGHF